MHRPASLPAWQRPNDPKIVRVLRWMLLGLILELTFEGIARKLNVHGTGVAIFFLKDAIVAAMGVQLFRLRLPPAIHFFSLAYIAECVLFVPVFVSTAIHDPILAVFGLKEYLLYPIVGLSAFVVFEDMTMAQMMWFFRWAALLLIPTTYFALLELRLPATHWLNLSVDGDSVEDFSAGGHLRVSSTFSFVAQFCDYLTAEVFMVVIALNTLRGLNIILKGLFLSLVPMLIISSYVTGSRSAVLANGIIVLIATVLALMKAQARSAMRMVAIICGLLLTLSVARVMVPDAFAAYSSRERGHLLGASNEVQGRIHSMLFDWMGDSLSTPFFGNGIGLMSNGSGLLSSYASTIRATLWTETDFATTLYEGGIYLIIVWYGFRYYFIFQVLTRFLSMRPDELSVPAAFTTGYVALVGFTATLGIQPPIAIWWWLSIGTALALWWKNVEPKKVPDGSDLSTPAAPKRPRGQSAYAARLHAHQNRP